MTDKANPYCEVARGGKPSDCILDCSSQICCDESKQGTQQYMCLKQTFKRMAETPDGLNVCGSCQLNIFGG